MQLKTYITTQFPSLKLSLNFLLMKLASDKLNVNLKWSIKNKETS